MNKIMLVILVCAVFTVPAAAHEVYLVPQQSNAAYRSTADVEIWVGATENEFQSGQINLTYDHNCANVTDWKRNTTIFSMGGWSHYDGRELITFLAADPLPTGKYRVGTLTIQCEKEQGGETVLAFAEPSKLFDHTGKSVAVTWTEGTFRCNRTLDTGAGTYPSISGTHNGTITPNRTIEVQMLYTYPCAGTGGHTEYARIWNSTLEVNATWEGYEEDWHNITFNAPFSLVAGETYNYTIKTGSYPQIHHVSELPTATGWINCTDFTDANGRTYYDWIPAISLEMG